MADLRDASGRRIRYLRVAVTDRCNFACRYCMPQQGMQWIPDTQLLQYDELLRIIRIFVRLGVDKIRVTGGEPLVREGIAEFLSNVSGIPGVKTLNLTTNGSLLEHYAHSIKTAGVHCLNISLDTLKPDRFFKLTGQYHLQTVLNGVNAARVAGFEMIKINMVVMNGVNSDELADFARMTIDKPYQVRFIEYMPFQRGKNYLMTASQMMEQLAAEGLTKLIPVPGELSTARIFRLPGARGTIGFISPVSQHFCGACNRIRVTPDGYIRPCLLANSEFLLRDLLRAGISEAALTEIIQKIVWRKPRRHQLAQDNAITRPMSRIGG